MKITKLIAALVGVPMVIGSFLLAVGGGVALAVPDDDGWVTAGPIGFATDSAALVAEDVEIDFGHNLANGRTFVSWGEIPAELEVSSRNDKSVFVGIARQEDARAYLSGVAQDRLTSFDDDHDVEHVAGAYQAPLPTESDIWVASTVDGTLEWDIRSGDWAIVALNRDGSPGIDLGVTASAQLPFLTAIGVVLIVLGVVGMTAGAALTYYGVRRVRERQSTAAVPPPDANPIVT
jgi:uncharacterized membrane protein YidH (DUF202 family)